MALTTEFSSSYMERMTTFTLGQCRSSSVVASMPFMPGRPMSMRTRSGSVFLQSWTASAPLSASPTTWNSAPRSRMVFTPSRTNLWSSTRTMSNVIVYVSMGLGRRCTHRGTRFAIARNRKIQSSLRGVMLHAQQPQPPISAQEIGGVEPLPIIPHLQGRTNTCGLYRDLDHGASGMLDGILNRLLRHLVHGGGNFGIDFERRVHIHPQDAGEAFAEAHRKPVEGDAQAGPFDRGGVQRVAVFADLLHHGLEQLLDLGDPAADAGGDVGKVHADQVELEAESGKVLADGIVQKAGDHGALEFLGLEGPQHGAAQFAFGDNPSGDVTRQAAGIADLTLHADGENRDVPDGVAPALAEGLRIAFQGAREAVHPGIGGFGVEGFSQGAIGQAGSGSAEDRRGVAIDANENAVRAGDPVAGGGLLQEDIGERTRVLHDWVELLHSSLTE